MTSNTNCCVFGCKTYRSKEPHISFHKFPIDKSGYIAIKNKFGGINRISKRKAWELALLMEKPSTGAMTVCSKHFKREDFHILSLFPSCKRPRLKANAVPSQNLPTKSITESLASQNEDKVKARNKRRTGKLRQTEVDETTIIQDNVDEAQDQGFTIELLDKTKHGAILKVNSSDLLRPFISKIKNDSHLNTLTGLSHFALLENICSLIAHHYYPLKCTYQLSLQDRVLLVFVKLKAAIKFSEMAILFYITPTTCKDIFNEYVQYIANVLKPCIFWPSVEERRMSISKCFHNFQSVGGVLEVMEIPLQKPKCYCCRIKAYSHYHGRTTIKFMTCVSPEGLLTFISKGYGGRASDKAMLEESKFINKLKPHIDSKMMDKGFLVDEICLNNVIKLERPLCLLKKKQFSPIAEAKKTVGLAKARVHAERVNQGIRVFEILHYPFPWNQVPYIDFIIQICCSVVNLKKNNFN